ncbi:YutD family protein [Paenibacillus humicola]|uniref:YutD family protein n=1 Tax=Paenibacillus humicola TaxID=3110540 RepID=UPI00237AA2A0|nr:YutD-like domain-containing protein [Paenibacillus humicola]
MYHIGGRTYALVYENKNGWNPEAFRDRYSEVLERYDYVIGDWGYNQLRLKGFFRDNHPKASRDSAISGAADYINEYCNFGCAYFVLEKQPNGRKNEHDEMIDLDALVPAAQPEDGSGQAESAAAAERPSGEPAAAPQVGRPAAERSEQPRQHQQRDGRRDFARGPRREGRDQPQAGRKPYAQREQGERESGGGARSNPAGGPQAAAQHERDRSGQPQGQQRSQRPRKFPFSAPKAPVAAASENPVQPGSPSRQNGGGPNGTQNGGHGNNR